MTICPVLTTNSAPLPPPAHSDEVLRWRARTSLRELAWQRLLDDIARMPESERSGEEWRYWQAMALARTGHDDASRSAFLALSEERSYYGFLAADEVDTEYALDDAALMADEGRY